LLCFYQQLDSLLPASAALENGVENFPEVDDEKSRSSLVGLMDIVAQAADDGAKATLGMKAQAGRASYVSAEKLVHPDPGATAAAIWIAAVCEAVGKAFVQG
jgi:hypothetical protein